MRRVHAVLDAAGEIHVFGFGVKNAFAALIAEVVRGRRGITDETSQGLNFDVGLSMSMVYRQLFSHVCGFGKCIEYGQSKLATRRAE